MTTKNTTLLVATATALLMTGCGKDDKAQASHADMNTADDTGQCHGVNSCKGQSMCMTDKSACHGQNACKGKGWLSTTKADCDAKGGEFKG